MARWIESLVLLIAASTVPVASKPPDNRVEVFNAYSVLARSDELLRRQLTPLEAQRVREAAKRSGKQLSDYGIDLKKERFAVHVPRRKPPKAGYGLLVFVPPWNKAGVPKHWISALDTMGIVFVDAADSGNKQPTVTRRIPLAVHAWANVTRRYPIDPQRVYIGGMSGGSRMALRIAIGWPDIFRGALLDAGSDPLGTIKGIPLPPPDLFRLVQEETRLVYITGSDDKINRDIDHHSIASMRQFCVFDVVSLAAPGLDHKLINGSDLKRAMRELERPSKPQPDLAECRERLQTELHEETDEVRRLVREGQIDRASDKLEQLDIRFGGLAAPESLELFESMR